MPEFINPNKYIVYLTGNDGRTIKINPGAKIELPQEFVKYCRSGHIREITDKTKNIIKHIINTNVNKQITENNNIIKIPKVKQTKSIAINRKAIKSPQKEDPKPKQIVGKTANIEKIVIDNFKNTNYSISNNIGVGILSYNRVDSLKRLINSIIKYTDLNKTTIFISDDCSDKDDMVQYLSEMPNNFVIIKNDERLGISGNSNRLLKCLSRFNNCLLLNDDVEVLSHGWEYFYSTVMSKTKLGHMVFRQPGIYNATNKGEIAQINNINLNVVYEKPHGAILAYTNSYFQKCGYFDQRYGLYGMEHVDWSSRGSRLNIQPDGFYDIEESSNYFRIHNDNSSISNKTELLNKAKRVFDGSRLNSYVDSDVKVPSVSYVVPFMELSRNKSLSTVLNNIKSQKFPNIEIILSEYDSHSKVNISDQNIKHIFTKARRELFNKSKAFNVGVADASHDIVILHDADMLACDLYTNDIYYTLQEFDSCHLGKNVIYANSDSTDLINNNGYIHNDVHFERAVGYFEGGSLASTVKKYWAVGGFNEDFEGYGNEDCEFYSRISTGNWLSNRYHTFTHLWHPRANNWQSHHAENTALEKKLKGIEMSERIRILVDKNKRYIK